VPEPSAKGDGHLIDTLFVIGTTIAFVIGYGLGWNRGIAKTRKPLNFAEHYFMTTDSTFTGEMVAILLRDLTGKTKPK
jgi:hypothetical protein